ncbi:MAG: family 78 glycoside hydrolase catalytic domain [Bacteroidaceae bacterium]|nr:family 78 glycoside hydrolase catalytic domain [Bacteroidaceae bacterium]
MKHYLLLLFFLLLPIGMKGGLKVMCPRVCGLVAPLGIDTRTPMFSWELTSDERGCHQVSYAVSVAAADGTEVWNSGVVNSSRQMAVPYAGAVLKSCSAYTWNVSVTDNRGRKATAASTFETAFMDASEWTAQWIAAPESSASTRVPFFYKAFQLPQGKRVRRARIYASALGVFTMRLNGLPVTDAVLEPGESEYERTVLYSTYDVTALLHRAAANTLTARVAGGIYNVQPLSGRFSKGEVTNHGTSALLAELLVEYADGTSERIVTDGTWLTAPSPTLGSNWWGGEDYDATAPAALSVIASAGASPVRIVKPHFTSPHSGVSGFGTLRSRMYQPLRVVEEWPAVSVKTIQSGGYTLRMVDFGRNSAGQYRFRLKGKSGQTISLRCGESLNPDGSVYMENFYTGPADTYDQYTFSGEAEGETWGPEFMYHGFRYLQIIGLDEEPRAEDFTAQRIRCDMANVGRLHTSNPLVNDIHVLCRDAIASQLYNSITDCPHREKLGWLDVPNEMFASLALNFDMQAFYRKVVLDCFDAQQPDGHVPSVAPYYMEVYGNDVNWGGAAILVPYRCWRYYGDASLMRQYYPQMQRLIAHYTDHTTDYIINNDFSVLSDWGQETAGVSPMVPTEFTETTTYYYLLVVMAEMAAQLGHPAEADAYEARAVQVKRAFNAKFYDAATATYTSIKGGGGRQGEQAMPLYYGLVPDGDEQRVADVLANRVRADGYKIKTGEIALKPVFMTLAQYGHNDVVWQMANQTDCPSYGYWVRQGYTTTPEYWDVGPFSQNHCMMDHIEEWFYTQLAGIQGQWDKGKGLGVSDCAFQHLRIAPYLPDSLDNLDVSTSCPYGCIRVSWQRTADGCHFQFGIPAGTDATIVLPVQPGSRITEGGRAIAAGRRGIRAVSNGPQTAEIAVDSGNYEFVVESKRNKP